MKNVSLFVLTAAAVQTSLFAANIDLSKLPPPAKQQDVTYAKDIRPIFDHTCVHCHGEHERKGKLRLDSLQGVLAGGKHGKVVIPGDSAHSKLVIAVSRLNPKFVMPPKPHHHGSRPGRPGGSDERPNPSAGGAAPPSGAAHMDEGEHERSNWHGTNGLPGGPGPRHFGPPPKPLTPEQVGLIRAWIDQGAK